MQEQRPANAGESKPSVGPGMANASQDGWPTAESDEGDQPLDTATPGGALGTASDEELKEDPEEESSKSDDRMETDER